MPYVWPQHSQLRQQLIGALQRGDIPAMEATCRRAIELIPGDATWHYNLACALAYREKPDLALAELEKAIDFGFRNADAIAKDQDLQRIQEDPRFKKLVEKARALAGLPVPGRPLPRSADVRPGATVTLNETNLVWNFDTGVYEAQLRHVDPARPTAELALDYSKSKQDAPERPYVAAWLSEGSAAGHVDDLYVNRDGGHSQLKTGDFPNLASIQLCPAAKSAGVHIDLPNTLFGDFAVFGNISRGRTRGPFWRSMARATMTDPGLPARMELLYRNNQFWVIPSVKDYGNKDIGDTFPAVAPWMFVSHGISWSDQPFLRAALAASACFPRPTKLALLRRHLMAPTLQWLLRSTRKCVRGESDYLSPKAHPTAFDAGNIDLVRIVEKAHALRPEQIPPSVALALVNSRTFPVKYPMPGRDYPDSVIEALYQTASSTAIILRAPEAVRTFLVQARTFPEVDPSAEFTWRVVHGDASAVKITAPLGETLNTPERGFAQIVIDRRSVTNRIDVACFARQHGTEWGAPSFFSFYPIPQERRVYRADGKIESIDYSNPDGVYSDPVIALPRRWKDTYAYAADGTPLGWTRSYNGKDAASFAPNGERIIERKPDGTPAKTIPVKYIARSTGDPQQPLELTYMDEQ